MGNVRLYGSTSGYTEVQPPAVAPDGVVVLPAVAGTLATTADVATAKAEAIAGSAFNSSVFLHTINGYGSTNNKIRRFTTAIRNSGADITYADSASLGATFTINTTGMYSVHFSDEFNTAGGWFGLSLNSTQLTTPPYAITAAHLLMAATTPYVNTAAGVSFSGYLTAGDVVRPHSDGNVSGSNSSVPRFSIARVG